MHLSANPPFCLEADWLNAQAFRWTERDDWLYGAVPRNALGHLPPELTPRFCPGCG